MKKVKMLVLMLCLVFAAGSLQAAYLDEDFESYDVGSWTNPDAYPDGNPADVGAVFWSATGGLIRLIDTNIDSPTAQPFGANSKFLNLYDNSASYYPQIRYGGDAVSGSGRFEMDFYFDDYWTGVYYNLYLYDAIDTAPSGLTATNAILIRFDGTTLRYYDGGWTDTTNAYSLDTTHTLTVDFDTDTDTSTVYIDGGLIGTYNFRNAVDQVAMVSFSGGGSQYTSLSIDNLKIVPVIPNTVTINLSDNADGTMDVDMDVTGGAVVRGVSLALACTGGAKLQDLGYGTPDAGLNTFIDYFATNALTEVTGDTPAQEGHPYADDAGAGVAAVNDENFSIVMGAFDGTGAGAGLTAGTYHVATVNTGAGQVCVTEDTLRNGIVGENLDTVTITDGVDNCLDVTSGECVKSGTALHTAWEDAGKPLCWCYAANCKGDADGIQVGDYRVQTNDLQILLTAFFQNPLPAGGQCANFDRIKVGDYYVQTNDLQVLLTNFFQAGVTDCDMTDYNNWETP